MKITQSSSNEFISLKTLTFIIYINNSLISQVNKS